ncbi:hypothetical protein TruAng_008539 [Truncatella angustata]|nr:hypothetical protein TruAng_008539 [Truncatella angustata]
MAIQYQENFIASQIHFCRWHPLTSLSDQKPHLFRMLDFWGLLTGNAVSSEPGHQNAAYASDEMPSPAPEQIGQVGFDEDEAFRVESDIVGFEAETEHGNEDVNSAQDKQESQKPAKEPVLVAKKKGRPANGPKKFGAKKPLTKPGPTIVRMDQPDESEGDEEDNFSESFPPISNLKTKASNKTNEVLKKRGRPFKSSAVDDSVESEAELSPKKKQRSRRAKNPAMEAEAEAEVPLHQKHRSGPAATVNSNPEEIEAPQPAPRGRGRPPKPMAGGVLKALKDSRALKSPSQKGALHKASDADVPTPSRPRRAAAESANLIITSQSNKKQLSRGSNASTSLPTNKKGASQPSKPSRGRPRKQSKGLIYAVEKIVDVRLDDNGDKMYCVKWVNFNTTENTWEPLENLKGCLALVHAFDKKKPPKAKKN